MAGAVSCSFRSVVHGDVVLGPPASAGGFEGCSGLRKHILVFANGGSCKNNRGVNFKGFFLSCREVYAPVTGRTMV